MCCACSIDAPVQCVACHAAPRDCRQSSSRKQAEQARSPLPRADGAHTSLALTCRHHSSPPCPQRHRRSRSHPLQPWRPTRGPAFAAPTHPRQLLCRSVPATAGHAQLRGFVQRTWIETWTHRHVGAAEPKVEGGSECCRHACTPPARLITALTRGRQTSSPGLAAHLFGDLSLTTRHHHHRCRSLRRCRCRYRCCCQLHRSLRQRRWFRRAWRCCGSDFVTGCGHCAKRASWRTATAWRESPCGCWPRPARCPLGATR